MWECLYANVSKNLACIEGSYLTFERPRKKTTPIKYFWGGKKKRSGSGKHLESIWANQTTILFLNCLTTGVFFSMINKD